MNTSGTDSFIWNALQEVPYLTGYIFISWTHRFTCPKDLAACSPAASHIPSSYPQSLQAQEHVQSQAFLTEVDTAKPQPYLWWQESFQEKTSPALCSQLKTKELSFSISSRLNLEISGARTTSKALQAQAQCSAWMKRCSQCHSAFAAITRESHHSLLYNVPAKSLTLLCSSWKREVRVSLVWNCYCFQDQQSHSWPVPI